MSTTDKLLRQWTLWYLIPDRFTTKDASWSDFLHCGPTFSTIDELWETINSMEKAAMLPKGCRYYVFKKGVKPLWEDYQNQGGFEISIEHAVSKAKRQKITERWLDCVFSLVGETLSSSEAVHGIEFAVRTSTYKIDYWVSRCDEDARNAIKKDLQKLTGWNTEVSITPIPENIPGK